MYRQGEGGGGGLRGVTWFSGERRDDKKMTSPLPQYQKHLIITSNETF